jgi:hypothetical protein
MTAVGAALCWLASCRQECVMKRVIALGVLLAVGAYTAGLRRASAEDCYLPAGFQDPACAGCSTTGCGVCVFYLCVGGTYPAGRTCFVKQLWTPAEEGFTISSYQENCSLTYQCQPAVPCGGYPCTSSGWIIGYGPGMFTQTLQGAPCPSEPG